MVSNQVRPCKSCEATEENSDQVKTGKFFFGPVTNKTEDIAVSFEEFKCNHFPLIAKHRGRGCSNVIRHTNCQHGSAKK